ncbi:MULTISPECIES: Crp/Fnr family transcriptional regulator [Sphingomonas]|uniref:Crp/Fnr family transcriptional regulator n=1 Tax=Sphingomonas TaxID=13687 RepID=UPI0013B36233|nr:MULTISPECIES: Crp/Fnr family transcriptional regulator [Sphingomonas]
MRSDDSILTSFGAHSVTGLLRHLRATDLTRIRTQLEAVAVSHGNVLVEVQDGAEYLFFSQGPLISIERADGIEIALVGSEGLVGWPALVGVGESPFRAVVRGRDGTVLRINVHAVLDAIVSSPAMGHLFQRFVTSMSIQMAETLSSCALRRVELRVARWILLRHDRVGGDEIVAQHEEIAANLGTRRASITDALHIIEGSGAVRCRRGRLLVRDRVGLEQLAAGSYGSAEELYRSAIGNFGKSTPRLSVPVETCNVAR